jgi:hypothetical protein
MYLEEVKKETYKLDKNTYLQKIKAGYRLIYPPKKDITKPLTTDNINWFNMLTGGSIPRLITLLCILFLILFISWGYSIDTRTCRELMANPYKICGSPQGGFIAKLPNLNLTSLIEEVDNEHSLSIPTSDNDKIL